MEALEIVLRAHDICPMSLEQRPLSPSTVYYRFSVRSADLLVVWQQLRQLVTVTGYSPVIMSDPSLLDRVEGTLSPDVPSELPSVDPLAAWYIDTHNVRAPRFNDEPLSGYPSPAWVVARVQDAVEQEYEHLGTDFVAYSYFQHLAATALTDTTLWSHIPAVTDVEQTGLAHYIDPARSPASYVVALLPTMAAWQIPALIRYAMEPLDPTTMALQWGWWHHQYGAHPVVIGRDSYMLSIDRPPSTPEAALLLAWEHSVYCFDVVDRLSLVEHARTLFRGEAWSFWWD